MAHRTSLTAGAFVAAAGAITLGALTGAVLPAGTDRASARADRPAPTHRGAAATAEPAQTQLPQTQLTQTHFAAPEVTAARQEPSARIPLAP